MDLEYSGHYAAFQTEVRDFIKNYGHLSPKSGGGRKKPDEKTLKWQRLLIDKGLVGRWIPKKYGGSGFGRDVLEDAIINDDLAAAGLHLGIKDAGTILLTPTLLEFGTEEQKRKWIPSAMRGEVVWCQGYSEPGAGSDLASLKTSARLEGDEFIVNGQKIWTTSAHFADMMVLLCRTEPDVPKHGGISYLLLPMHAKGVTVRPIKTMTGKASFNEVFMDDVRVPVENIVGGRGQGWTVSSVSLKHERLFLGDVNKLTDRFHRLEKLMRKMMIDGRPAIQDPVLVDRLTRLQAKVLALRYHEMRLLTEAARGDEFGAGMLIVKNYGTILASRLAALGVDVIGRAGLEYLPSATFEEDESTTWYIDYMYDLGLIIGGGSSLIQKNIIGERGLGMYRESSEKGA